MTTLVDIRQRYPQYKDMSDADLASALHAKFYSDMPRAEFYKRMGLGPGASTATQLAAVANKWIPGGERLAAFSAAAGKSLTGDRRGFWDIYDESRKIQQGITREAEQQLPTIPRVAAETAGLGLTTAATMGLGTLAQAPTITSRAGVPLAEATWTTLAPQTTRQVAADSARIGAAFGSTQGYLDSRGEGLERLGDTAAGAFGGAAIGAAVPYGIQAAQKGREGARSIWQHITGTRPQDRQAAAAVAQDFREAGVPVPGVVLAPPTQESTGRAVAASIGGLPLRNQVSRSAGEAERRLSETLGPQRTAEEAGQDAQAFLRGRLLDRSLPQEQLAAMSPQELAQRSGIPPDGIVPTPRPVVEPIQPRRVDPVQPRPVVPDDVRIDPVRPEVKVFRPEDVPVPPELRQRYDLAFDRGQQAQTLWKAEAQRAAALRAEAEKLSPGATGLGTGAIPPDPRRAQLLREAQQIEQAAAQRYKPLIDDAWAVHNELQAYRTSNVRNAQAEAEGAAMAAAERRTAALRQQEMERLRLEREQQAAAQTAQMRARAEEDARRATMEAQATAEREFQSSPQSAWTRGRSPETTYKDDFGLAYELSGRNIPPTVRERMDTRDGPVTSIMEGVRGDMRRRGLIQGDDRTASILTSPARDEIAAQLRKRLPADVVDSFMSGVPQGIKEIRAARTAVREMQSAPREARTIDDATLQRLEQALTDQFHGLLTKRGLTKQSEQLRVIDSGYRQYKEQLVEPLKPIFGDNVSADRAFDRLLSAARGKDVEMLRAFMRVHQEKGDPGKAARAIVGHMSEGGLAGFVKGYGEMSPEAKRILFAGSNRELGQSLDRLHRVGSKLQPWMEIVEKGESVVNSKLNMLKGATFIANWQAAVGLAAGELGLAFAMTRPSYVNWLTRGAEMQMRGATDAQMRQHLARLGPLTANDAELGVAIMESVGEVFGVTSPRQPLRVTIPIGRQLERQAP